MGKFAIVTKPPFITYCLDVRLGQLPTFYGGLSCTEIHIFPTGKGDDRGNRPNRGAGYVRASDGNRSDDKGPTRGRLTRVGRHLAGLGQAVLDLPELHIDFRVHRNVLGEGTWPLTIRLSPGDASLLGEIINVMLHSVNQGCILHAGTFLLLRDEIIVLIERHRALLEFPDVVSGILLLERVATRFPQLDPPVMKAGNGAESVSAVRVHQIVGLLANSQSGFRICDLGAVGRVAVMVTVHPLDQGLFPSV